MNWIQIRRALLLSTSSVLMAAQVVTAQEDQMAAYRAEVQASQQAGPADVVAMEDAQMDATAEAKAGTAAIVSPMRVFTITADGSNTSGHITYIDDPLSNGNPTATLIVTPNWNPNGGTGVYNNHPIGVWYNGSKWAIYNQDYAAMPLGASFNVRIGDAFVHEANPTNIVANWTEIDNPLTNNNPSAIVTVTANWNPGGGGGIYNNHPIGVWYTGAKWAIYNQDLASMPSGACFNVVVGNAFVHNSTPANISGNFTVITNGGTDGNLGAKVFATPNWNPNDRSFGIYNNHDIGVWFTGTKWSVYNQDIAAMPNNAAFNVMVYHVPTIANIAVNRKKLIITGSNFGNGAVVMVNGVDRLTVNDLNNPTTKLKVRKTLNSIPPGTTVTVQIRNADGLLSDPVSFTRP